MRTIIFLVTNELLVVKFKKYVPFSRFVSSKVISFKFTNFLSNNFPEILNIEYCSISVFDFKFNIPEDGFG